MGPRKPGRARLARGGLILGVSACALRLIYDLEQFGSNPLFDTPVVDAQIYSSWAQEILHGHFLWPELRNYLPVYPAFLALCELLTGTGAWGVKIIQALLSSVSAVLLSIVVARAFGRRAGFIAGALFAGNWLFVIYDAERYSESLCNSALVAFLYFHTRPKRSLLFTLAAGLACAIACGCRPNLLPLLAVGTVHIVTSRLPGPVRARQAAAFAGVALLIFVPIVWHNHRLSGGWMLRAQQSWNLYAALSPEIGGLHPASGPAFNHYIDAPVRKGMLSEAEQDEYWAVQVRKLLRERPGPALYNYFVRRGLIFLDATEWSQEFDAAAFRACSTVLSLPWPGFGVIFALATAGLVSVAVLIRRRRGTTGGSFRVSAGVGAGHRRFLLACLIVVALFTFAGKAAGRYRLPVALMLIPWAGVGADRLIFPRRRSTRVPALLGLVAATVLTAPDWADLAHRQTAHHEFYIGLKNESEGRDQEAEAAYRLAVARQPEDAAAPLNLARLLARERRLPEALATVTESLRREPGCWEAWNLRSSIALDLKQWDSALDAARRSLDLYAPQSEGWMRRSEAEFELGRWDAWREAARQAIAQGADASFRLEDALRLERHGQYPEAAEELAGVEADRRADAPLRVQAQLLRCDVVAIDLHHVPEARACWEQLLARFPHEESVRELALLLLGRLDEGTYRHGTGAQERAPDADFNVGLARFVQGHAPEAISALRDYLQKRPPTASPPADLPARWAWQIVRDAQ
jgi:tetratricopeptide (TPR) repeat protein